MFSSLSWLQTFYSSNNFTSVGLVNIPMWSKIEKIWTSLVMIQERKPVASILLSPSNVGVCSLFHKSQNFWKSRQNWPFQKAAHSSKSTQQQTIQTWAVGLLVNRKYDAHRNFIPKLFLKWRKLHYFNRVMWQLNKALILTMDWIALCRQTGIWWEEQQMSQQTR